PARAAVAEHVYARRKHKGVTREQAHELAADPFWFAASLVALGRAHASVGGCVATTAHVIRAGIQCVGMAEGARSVSSMFLMVRGDTVLSYADCGVLPDPEPQQLADLAALTARQHARFTGQTPRVAFLSFSTRGSADHDRVRKVQQAAQL